MTVVAALEATDGVWLACDSCVSSEYEQDVCGPKWMRLGKVVIGTAGNDSHLALLEAKLKCRPYTVRQDPEAWARKVLWPAIDRVLAKVKPKQRPELMAIVHGSVLHASCGAYRTRRGYGAIGSGGMYALGSLATSKGRSPEKRITMAVQAAIAHCPTVDGPIHTLWIPR